MEIEKIPFQEAMQTLAKEVGIELKTNMSKEKQDQMNAIYDIYKNVASAYHDMLLQPQNKDKLTYLLDRGLTEATIRKFQIGYSENGQRIWENLTKNGYLERDIMETGIFMAPGKDKFYSRITFPITSIGGNVIAFTGRIVGSGEPKYLNSPGSRIFDKSNTLFGFSYAKIEIAKRDYVIIVEGQMDTITLHQHGYENTVAVSGSTLTQEQIETLSRFTRIFYLGFDQDTAGVNATFSALENTKNTDTEVRIISFGKAKDPDEFLKNGGDFNEVLAHYLTPVGFYLEQGEKRFDLTTVPGKKAFIHEVFSFLKNIRSSIEIDIHLKEISRKLDISLDILYTEFRQMKTPTKPKEKGEQVDKKFGDMELIAGYITNYDYFDLFFEKFKYNIADISQETWGHLLKEILSHKNDLEQADAIDMDYLKSIELLIETENEPLGDSGVMKKFVDLVHRFNISLWEKEKNELENMPPQDKNTTIYLQKYNALLQKKQSLRV